MRSHALPNIVRFARVLRGSGMDVTTAQTRAFIDALEVISIRRRDDVKLAGRAIFAHRREHHEVYDRAFDAFWRAGDTTKPISLGEIVRRSSRQAAVVHARTAPGGGEATLEIDAAAADKQGEWSAVDVLRHKDFAELTPDELRQVRVMMQQQVLDVPLRRTRRTARDSRGTVTDMRRTIRRSLRYGGEVLAIERRRRRTRTRPLVLLCDISGSMEPYSRVLLQFMSVVTRTTARVETFAFGTRLTRLTQQLRDRSVDTGLQRAAAAIVDWAGGTRIGESLKTFNFEWGRRVLGGGAVVLLISDGCDRGDPALLAGAMGRLRRSCHRIVWLNPLAGAPGYEPLTRGMQAALPYIDELLPVHNLYSLAQLARRLSSLRRLHNTARREERRPGSDASLPTVRGVR